MGMVLSQNIGNLLSKKLLCSANSQYCDSVGFGIYIANDYSFYSYREFAHHKIELSGVICGQAQQIYFYIPAIGTPTPALTLTLKEQITLKKQIDLNNAL